LLKSQDLGGPGVSDFYTMLGLYYRGRGEDAKAIENFKQALVIDPGNSGAKRELEEMKK
jgi:Tfp pilus assembly protein PilF